MSPMRIIILVGAAGAAIGAALLMRNMSPDTVTQTVTNTQTVVQTEQVSSVKVLVSTTDLKVGEVLSEDDLEWAPWPEENIVEGYKTEADAPDAIKELAGSVAKLPLFKREPVHPAKLVLKGDNGVMAALLTPGMRAISLEISEETASGGFILPNDRVDVILAHDVKIMTEESTIEQPTSTTLIQNVRVLAIDQVFKQSDDEEERDVAQIGNTATLEVTDKEAELLALGVSVGSITLTLRPWSDVGPETPRKARIDLLDNLDSLQGGASGVRLYRNGQGGES
jgi:pilus assembly protein CpaB